jgi:hypothetical protein
LLSFSAVRGFLNRLARRPAVLGAGVLLGSALAASCTKEYEEPSLDRLPLLTGVDKPNDTTYTRWRVTARTGLYDGQAYDLYATGNPCRHDDFREFRPDTIVFWQPGPIHCPTPEQDTVWGHWQLSENADALLLRADPELPHDRYTISELTSQKIVLTWTGVTGSGAPTSETITLTAVGP